MSKGISEQWASMNPFLKSCIAISVFVGFYVLGQRAMVKVVWDIQDNKVIGSNSVSGQSQAVSVDTRTYYLSSSFDKSVELSSDLDEALFIESAPKKMEKPTIVEPVVQQSTETPLETYVRRALTVNGIEADGAFINGRYYVWGEKLDTTVITSKGKYTPVVKRGFENRVVVSVNGLEFSLAVSI